MDSNSKIQIKSLGLFILLSLIWGSSFILIKKALIGFSPFEVAALRILFSSVVFFPFFLKYLKQIEWDKWLPYLLVGLTGSGIPAFMYPIGQMEISSSVAGILNSTTPIFTFLIGIIFFRSQFVWSKFVGILIGLFGTSMLILYGESQIMQGNQLFSLFIIIGTICYGTNINIVKSVFQETVPLKLSAISFTMIGPPALVYLFINGTLTQIQLDEVVSVSIGAILILSILGTVVSTVLFFRLVQKTSTVFASSVAYFIPIVAILWGFLDGEKISWIHFLGMALILFGVWLIRKK